MRIALQYKISFLAAGIGLFLFACTSEPENSVPPKERIFKGFHYSLDSILQKKEGIVHGVELSEPLNDVKSKEQKKPDELDVDYCLYNYKVDSLTSYSIAYTFEKDSLDEIELQINSSSLDEGSRILNNIKKYYTEKYTSPLMDKGIYVFNCFDSKKRNFKISLTDNSTTETGIINVLVYREK